MSMEMKKSSGSGGFECKICGKRFDSFQALGGHQGIHKKAANKQLMITSDDAAALCSLSLDHTPAAASASGSSSSSSSLMHHHHHHHHHHRCKMCAKEFTSGQALGGHMTRHRLQKQQQEDEEAKANFIMMMDQRAMLAAAALLRLKEEEDQRRTSELVLAAKELRLYL